MMIKNLVGKIMVMFLLCAAISVQTSQAYAYGGHGGGGGGWHGGGGGGGWHGGGWHGGWGGGWGWGWPVMGLAVLGATATTVWIANRQYYYYDGLYYDNTPQGYVVVTPQYGGPGGGDIISVNVPNGRNGYTAVVIKRSGNGYVGPQGEFYTEFPKVSQLRLMYGN